VKPTALEVTRLEEALRAVAPFLSQAEQLECGVLALRLRRAAGMRPQLVALAGRVQWHRDAGTFDPSAA
jgi:hypothetical protein